MQGERLLGKILAGGIEEGRGGGREDTTTP